MNLNRLFLSFAIVLSSTLFAQELSYEQKALDYFIQKIEGDQLFNKACDCKNLEYSTKKPLRVYNASFSSVNQAVGICKIGLPWNDSLLNSALDWKSTKLNLQNKQERIQLTDNPKDFGETHYLIRFADRLFYQNRIVLEFNIKAKEDCSGLNYIFLFNEKGEIEKHQLLVLCDSQG